MRRIVHFSVLCAVALLAAGCSTPASRFYTLSRAVPSAAEAGCLGGPLAPPPPLHRGTLTHNPQRR